jgi:hypothetical protein
MATVRLDVKWGECLGRVVAGLFAVALLAAASAGAQIVLGEINGSYQDRQGKTRLFRGYIAFLRMEGTPFLPVVTKPAPTCVPPAAPLLLTADWAQQVGAFLAVNASFGEPEQEYKPGDCLTVFGPVKSDGFLVAPNQPRQDGQGNPAILFAKSGAPQIKMATKADVDTAYNVVSGQWDDTPSGRVNGSLLIQDGALLGASALPVPFDTAPRTAVGLTKDKKVMMLAVIEGRLSGSDGIALPALAKLLATCGAWDAVNLDGGGSSAMTYLPDLQVPMSEDLTLYNYFKGCESGGNPEFNVTQRDPRVPFASRPMSPIGMSNLGYRPVTIHFGFKRAPAPR